MQLLTGKNAEKALSVTQYSHDLYLDMKNLRDDTIKNLGLNNEEAELALETLDNFLEELLKEKEQNNVDNSSPLKHSIANQKIEIRTGKNKRFEAYFAVQKLQITEVTEPETLYSEANEFQKKLEVLALADRLGNVAEAFRLSGFSRDTTYRNRKLIIQGGIDSLKRQEAPDLHHKIVLITLLSKWSSNSP